MKILPIAVVALCLTAAAAWTARGFHDEHFLLEGRVHVINHAQVGRRVTLSFPSGASTELDLPARGSVDLLVPETGEGSIRVAIDGVERDEVGYVTSINDPIVLVVGEHATTFSQVRASQEPQLVAR
jgi:hypothetical protein